MFGEKIYKNMIYVENHPFQRTDWLENGEVEICQELLDHFSGCKKERVEVKEKRRRGRPRTNHGKSSNTSKSIKQYKNTLDRPPKKLNESQSDDTSSLSSNSSSELEERDRNKGLIFNPELGSDQPEKVADVKYIEGIKCFMMKWMLRSDGISPENSYVPSELIKRHYPDFYDNLGHSYKSN